MPTPSARQHQQARQQDGESSAHGTSAEVISHLITGAWCPKARAAREESFQRETARCDLRPSMPQRRFGTPRRTRRSPRRKPFAPPCTAAHKLIRRLRSLFGHRQAYFPREKLIRRPVSLSAAQQAYFPAHKLIRRLRSLFGHRQAYFPRDKLIRRPGKLIGGATSLFSGSQAYPPAEKLIRPPASLFSPREAYPATG